jgi:hypothetical protein
MTEDDDSWPPTKDAKEILTPERAQRVKHLRCVEDRTWRSVAVICRKEFHGSWEPPENQLWGVALCRVAARILGEDPNKEPWN